MANQEHLNKLEEGVVAWNLWREEYPRLVPDLGDAILNDANLVGANLRRVFFDRKTELDLVAFSNGESNSVSVADVSWGGVNLTVVDWESVKLLGDEFSARSSKNLSDYQSAVRANRQLAVVLRDQGLNEEADRFAYRAQLLQRVVWRMQKRPLKYMLSWFLWLLAGYGYRPLRSLLLYTALILGFALAFYSFGHLRWYEALVVSLTAFRGRGFFSQQYQPGDPQSIIAAIEAVVGLVIEISFIATFTQRFFGR